MLDPDVLLQENRALVQPGGRQRIREYRASGTAALVRTQQRARPDGSSDPSRNRLEALERDRARQHSIRIDDQYRVCFTWKEDGPHDAEITKHYR